MLSINIENPELESKFRKFAKENKRELQDLINDALKMYLDAHYHEITYEKKIKHKRGNGPDHLASAQIVDANLACGTISILPRRGKDGSH